MIWLLAIGLVLLAGVVLALALCKVAARADQAMHDQLVEDDGRTADLRAQGEEAA